MEMFASILKRICIVLLAGVLVALVKGGFALNGGNTLAAAGYASTAFFLVLGIAFVKGTGKFAIHMLIGFGLCK